MLQNDPWDDHIMNSDDLKEEKDCPICYIDYEKGDNVAKLRCGHIFHKNCIILWFDKNVSTPTCPICRKNMFEASNQNQLTNEVQTNNENEDFYTFNNTQNRNQTTDNPNKKHSSSCCCILI